ncbi:MAG: type II secretion system protein [Candidatus Omnitrophica bacterium]|nr:type II secretion system protein [Candidatus Omnitrophota bacterium]
MFLKSTKKAITLIEIVAVIIVLGVAVTTLINLLFEVTRRANFSEEVALANFYTQGLMEEIVSKRFDENACCSWTAVADLGASADGEDPADKTTFDDVDDFHGFSDIPQSSYARSVVVEYQELSTSTWQAASSPPTDFKKITVSVTKANGEAGTVEMESLVSGY